ncbi:redoxin family protein [Runella sp. CRIBMP]|uniref:TlpA family protein disulfide reductase n=1 Tax=Runella sp. CRIBMP TaxID=2683261 RepID=UPI0014120822|nr:TlpA disulfide reductase family protein [Runella sp. CRIBMP]NBB21706.1 redoxin family protein [Runella sp. CRIBMP]
MRQIINFFIVIVFSCNSHSQSESFLRNEIAFEALQTITIINEVHKNETISWQIFDEYGDTAPPFEYNGQKSNLILKIETPHPVRALTADINTNKPLLEMESWTSFLIYPGDSLIAYKDANGYTRLRSLKDNVRTNELDFLVDLKQRVGEIEGPRAMFPIKFPVDKQVKLSKERNERILEYLNIFEKKKTVSSRFKSYIMALCKFDEIYYLERDYFSPFILEQYKKKFPIGLVSTYDNLSKDFECDECIYVNNYKNSSLFYVYFLCQKMGLKSDISNLYAMANKNFKGKIKDYLLFKIIKMKIEKNAQEDGVEPLLKRFYLDCKNDDYVKYIKNNVLLSDGKEPLQKDFMSSVLFKSNSKKYSLNYLLQSSKEKVLYIDFWASWCSPCIAEMPASHQLQQLYMGKEINFAFISLDKNRMAWEKSMTRIGINPENDSYILANNFESTFAKHFKISSIPRYILIGKDGKVISADAPRPSDPKLRQIFDELLKK